MASLGYGEDAVSASLEEGSPGVWTEKVYRLDITNGLGKLYRKPGCNPLRGILRRWPGPPTTPSRHSLIEVNPSETHDTGHFSCPNRVGSCFRDGSSATVRPLMRQYAPLGLLRVRLIERALSLSQCALNAAIDLS